MNKQRQQMLDIIKRAKAYGEQMQTENSHILFSVDEYLAELLIHDNVILLPCRIGDIVYMNERYWRKESDPYSNLVPWKITNYSITCNKKNLRNMKYRVCRVDAKGRTTEPAVDIEFNDIDICVFPCGHPAITKNNDAADG